MFSMVIVVINTKFNPLQNIRYEIWYEHLDGMIERKQIVSVSNTIELDWNVNKKV